MDLALRASLTPATSKPALFLEDRTLVYLVPGDGRVWFRVVLGLGEIVWVPIWMPALPGLVPWSHCLTFLSLSSVICQRG